MKSFLLFNLLAFTNCLQTQTLPQDLSRKHFCPDCKTKEDALDYSLQRNQYFWDKNQHGAVTGINTVFAVRYGNDYERRDDENGTGWFWWRDKVPERKVDTYVCNGLPTTPPFTKERANPCNKNAKKCWPGPFRNMSGHFDPKKMEC